MKTRKTLFLSVLFGISAQTGGLFGQIDPAATKRLLEEAAKSKPEVRSQIEGAVDVHNRLPDQIEGGDSIPASPGHPFAQSPLVTDETRHDAKGLLNPMVTILRGADHNNPEELIRTSELMQRHMSELPSDMTLNDKYGHIKKCPVCGPKVSHTIHLHEEAVATAPAKTIALFQYGSADLTRTATQRLEEFAEVVSGQSASRVCLVGRASRVGGTWDSNQTLSERRTDSVAAALRAAGVAPSKITTLWLGWDEPQLNDINTQKYGLGPLWREAGSQSMNQSVVAVMYVID